MRKSLVRICFAAVLVVGIGFVSFQSVLTAERNAGLESTSSSTRHRNNETNHTNYASRTETVKEEEYKEEEIAVVDCVEVRGEFGEWVQDYDYARQVQYLPLAGFRQRNHYNKETKAIQQGKLASRTFLQQTTFAWNETKYPECQMQLLKNRKVFCDVLHSLNITNVYMAGDSMMGAMHTSLLGLLGVPKSVGQGERIKCPSSGSAFRLFFDRTILYSIPKPPDNSTIRMDQWGFDSIKVVPNYGQVGISACPAWPSLERNNKRKREYVTDYGACPWVKEYASLKGRTLLIVNTGAAYHATETFNRMFDGVVDALDNVTSKQHDIAFFRSVSAGHDDCFNDSHYPKAPLSTFDEYLAYGETSRYAWNLFRLYNDYAKNRIKERQQQQDDHFPLRYLNIFNVTALRPDGHVAANDCLHYELPAVVDWWNHLLYTNLVDIAASEQEANDDTLLVGEQQQRA